MLKLQAEHARIFFFTQWFRTACLTRNGTFVRKDEYFYEKEAAKALSYAAFGVTATGTAGKVALHIGGFDDPLPASSCPA